MEMVANAWWCAALLLCLGGVTRTSGMELSIQSGGRLMRSAKAHQLGRAQSKPKVAVMVLAMKRSNPQWHDAFAVLAHSINHAFEKSSYDFDLLAVTQDSIESDERSVLEGLGFKVVVKPLPLPRESVMTDHVREALTRGCDKGDFQSTCWESEAMKLWGVALTQYKRVVISDGDMIWLNNIDELFGRADDGLVQATYDHELDIGTRFTNDDSSIPLVNSGFVVVEPRAEDFEGILNLGKEGDFRGGTGWKGLRVGWGFCGVGSQGLFAAYYNMKALMAGENMIKAPDLGTNMTKSPASSRILPLDRSVYNVIDTSDLREALHTKKVSMDDVKVFHFTGGCMKPWTCQSQNSDICKTMTDHWWSFRSEVALAKNMPAPERCAVGGTYTPLSK